MLVEHLGKQELLHRQVLEPKHMMEWGLGQACILEQGLVQACRLEQELEQICTLEKELAGNIVE